MLSASFILLQKWSTSISYTMCAILFAWLLWPPSRRWWVARKIPGPAGYPIVGSALQLQGTGHMTFNVINRWFKEYGCVFKTWSLLNLTIFISDPADIKQILGNNALVNRSAYFMEAAFYFVGGGLITARGAKWKRHRKILNPLFQVQVLETFVDMFVQRSQQMCEKMDAVADGRTIDHARYLSCITIDTICKTVIGSQSESLPGGEEGMVKFYELVSRCDELILARVFYPWLMVPWLQSWFALGKEALVIRQAISTFMDGVYSTERRGTFSNQELPSVNINEADGFIDEAETGKHVVTMLDLMMKVPEEGVEFLSLKKIKHEVLGITLAGFTTTAIGMSILLVLLGIHKNVQHEISREMDEIFGNDVTRPVTAKDLPHFKTLERAIKESLRLFPTAALIPREIPEDLMLSSGLVLPAGSNAMIFSYATHRNENYYPDSDQFIPDRWLPENRVDVHPYAYIPFSAGIRSCIGHKYAMLQMKAVISTLLRRYKVSTKHTMEDLNSMSLTITLKMVGKYEVQLERR